MTFYRSKGPEVSILGIGEYSEEWILVLVSAWQKVQSNIPRHNLALTDTEWRDEYREPLLCRCLQAASVFHLGACPRSIQTCPTTFLREFLEKPPKLRNASTLPRASVRFLSPAVRSCDPSPLFGCRWFTTKGSPWRPSWTNFVPWPPRQQAASWEIERRVPGESVTNVQVTEII